LQALAAKVVKCKTPQDLNWAILDLAAKICLRENPKCPECPVKKACSTGRVVMGKLGRR
jgi:adenine-specific DNA glycosylase